MKSEKKPSYSANVWEKVQYVLPSYKKGLVYFKWAFFQD